MFIQGAIYAKNLYMKSIIIHLILTFFLTFLQVSELSSQNSPSLLNNGFEIELFLGSNFSQLYGDGQNGFTFLGISTGSFINYKLSHQYSFGIGLEYNQRGSNPSFAFIASDDQDFIKLQYLSIPVLVSISTSTTSAAAHPVQLRLGFSLDRLFSVSTSHPVFSSFKNDFQSYDIFTRLGINYSFSNMSSIDLHYEHALTDILKGTDINMLEGLRSFSFHVGYRYRL